MRQKQIQRVRQKKEEETPAEPAASKKGEALKGELDAVLEENAEEFVRGYVQKGGE